MQEVPIIRRHILLFLLPANSRQQRLVSIEASVHTLDKFLPSQDSCVSGRQEEEECHPPAQEGTSTLSTHSHPIALKGRDQSYKRLREFPDR